MRFLIVSAAILACASAGLISPLVYGVNPGDAQAAAIDATVAAQDHARLAVENHNGAVEQAAQHNTEALRYAAETNRNIHENAVWNTVAAQQTAASALSGAAAAAEPHIAASYAYGAAPLAYGAAPLAYGAAPLAYAAGPLGYGAAHLGYGAGHLAYGAPLAHAW